MTDIGRYFWNPAVFSYAMIPPQLDTLFSIVTSIVYGWNGVIPLDLGALLLCPGVKILTNGSSSIERLDFLVIYTAEKSAG
jgi:hypothetical protein